MFLQKVLGSQKTANPLRIPGFSGLRPSSSTACGMGNGTLARAKAIAFLELFLLFGQYSTCCFCLGNEKKKAVVGGVLGRNRKSPYYKSTQIKGPTGKRGTGGNQQKYKALVWINKRLPHLCVVLLRIVVQQSPKDSVLFRGGLQAGERKEGFPKAPTNLAWVLVA